MKDADRCALLRKISGDKDYQDWLADRFFIFYLNRTRTYRQNNKGQADPQLQLKLQKLSSIESRYISNITQTSKEDQNASDILERPQNFLKADSDAIQVADHSKLRSPDKGRVGRLLHPHRNPGSKKGSLKRQK